MHSLLDTYNASILAIPAYYVLSILPHSYALTLAAEGKLSKFDNRNPRDTNMKAIVEQRLDAETFAKYQRAEACHANGMENMPLFATAVILGNLAGLKKGGLVGFTASFLAVRIAYTFVYVNNNTQGLAALRSGLWVAGVTLCFRTIFKAAKVLGGAKAVL